METGGLIFPAPLRFDPGPAGAPGPRRLVGHVVGSRQCRVGVREDEELEVAMAVPLCLLYVISIGLVRLFGRPPTEEQRKAFWDARKKAKAERA